MIVFGHNNFLIEKYTAKDLQMPEEQGWEFMSFEVRQRYAHLFWIPFFPIGKVYVIKKQGSDDMFDMPLEIQTRLKQLYGHEIKTKWYSYALIVIAMVVGLGYLGNEKINSYKYQNYRAEQVERENLMLEFPTTGDYYVFDKYTNTDGNREGKVVLKVVGVNEGSVDVISMNEKLVEDIDYINEDEVYTTLDFNENKKYNKLTLKTADLQSVYKNIGVIEGIGDCKLREFFRRKY